MKLLRQANRFGDVVLLRCHAAAGEAIDPVTVLIGLLDAHARKCSLSTTVSDASE